MAYVTRPSRGSIPYSGLGHITSELSRVAPLVRLEYERDRRSIEY